MMSPNKEQIKKLNQIGVALSKEKNLNALLEMIVTISKDMTNADAASLYLLINNSHLKFEIVHTDSLNYSMGGTSDTPCNFPFIPLYKEDGQANLKMVVAYSVIKQEAVNIADAYASEEFDFSGTKEFDQSIGYRSQSFLTLPMKDHNGQVIGALQLINALDPKTKEVISFSQEDLELAESLSSQAAVALSQKKLVDSLRQYISLQKIINNIMLLAWENKTLEQQLSHLSNILLELPLLSPKSRKAQGGGVYLANKFAPIVVSNNLTEPDACHSYYLQMDNFDAYKEHEVYYQAAPISDEYDHLIIPLLKASQCYGLLFFPVKAAWRMDWEDELYLLSTTEPIATILDAQYQKLQQEERLQSQASLIDELEESLLNSIARIEADKLSEGDKLSLDHLQNTLKIIQNNNN